MKVRKQDFPKITFRPTEAVKQDFRKKCFDLGVTQDEVLINLVYGWTHGRIKIPKEG